MSKVTKQEWSLLLYAFFAIGLSFPIREYSEFLAGLIVGLSAAALVKFAFRLSNHLASKG